MDKEFIIKRGMLFYADLGSSNSSVQCGIRPVIITGNNLQGKYGPIITVIPVTTKVSKKRLLTHTLLIDEVGLSKESVSMAEQITTISKDRLISCVGKLREKTMQEIDKTIDIALALTDVEEQEIKKQVEEVKRWENNINDLKDIIPKIALEQIKLRYRIELNKLNNICDSNGKNMKSYYIENINLFSRDIEVSIR